MQNIPPKLEKRLEKRKLEDAYRELPNKFEGIDFYSNDYLGFASSKTIAKRAEVLLKEFGPVKNGATGSRLLSGNHEIHIACERYLADFHNAPAALLYNSGYDANIGLFSALPQRGDLIFYDEFVHASIRDGLKMSNARSFKFQHNSLEGLKEKIRKNCADNANIYIVTESVFSMDGDQPDLAAFCDFAEKNQYYLIVDEAHATGVIGEKGEGLVQSLNLEARVFARIHTFGKALGAHGAVILGNEKLREFLINFSRSFIFTTALSPHSIAVIMAAYRELEEETGQLQKLQEAIAVFKKAVETNNFKARFISGNSAIQSCIIPGNNQVKTMAKKLFSQGYLVKPILAPTVPLGKERLRFCLHSYNSKSEIKEVFKLLK